MTVYELAAQIAVDCQAIQDNKPRFRMQVTQLHEDLEIFFLIQAALAGTDCLIGGRVRNAVRLSLLREHFLTYEVWTIADAQYGVIS
jgi:hypothetical protein